MGPFPHDAPKATITDENPAGTDGFEQRITTGRGTNVLARIPGTDPGGPGPLIGAHYDHQDLAMVTHPGAYDNATAVAATLSIACRLAARPAKNDVIVACFLGFESAVVFFFGIG